MFRTIGFLLVLLLLFVLAGCGEDAPPNRRLNDDQIRLLKSLRSELDAKVAGLKPHVAERQKSYAMWKAEEDRSTSEESTRYTAARETYWEALFKGDELRLAIIDLQLRIQRIEGFWETDPDVKALGDPKGRDHALWRLLTRNADYSSTDGEKEASCRAHHVVSCPQRVGPPMVAVFKAEGWEKKEGPGLAIGHIILFLSAGSHVPYFQGANVITKDGVVKDLHGDGIVEIADAIICGGGGGDDFYKFYVLPITPEQKDSLQVWCRETHDADGDFVVWGLKAAPSGASSAMDLVIGVRDANGHLDERARYVWSRAESRWVGPRGSTTGEFYRFDPRLDEDSQVEAFANRRALKSPGR